MKDSYIPKTSNKLQYYNTNEKKRMFSYEKWQVDLITQSNSIEENGLTYRNV